MHTHAHLTSLNILISLSHHSLIIIISAYGVACLADGAVVVVGEMSSSREFDTRGASVDVGRARALVRTALVFVVLLLLMHVMQRHDVMSFRVGRGARPLM
jgi:hypothetical protein